MTVLYRKYRPQKFEDVAGQNHVVETLKNAFKRDQVAHAYLFAGPRGTGKTSVARILAKVLNCPQEKEAEPCGKCDVCRAISGGKFLDLVEIDAASNRGIDDVRSLREQVNFQPVRGQRKVYVLDEVHMLTKEAFNALLKTLEEPPAHVVFVLCTTEPQRIPNTVVSRCQRFDFHLAEDSELADYLRDISQRESLVVEEEAIQVVASQARGSYRDALGLLEQVNIYTEEGIGRDDVERVLGLVGDSEVERFLALVVEEELVEAVEEIERLVSEGRDVSHFIDQLIVRAREQLQVALGEGNSSAITFWIRLIEHLQEAQAQSTFSTLPQLPLEIALLKFLRHRQVEGCHSSGGCSETEVKEGDKEEVVPVSGQAAVGPESGGEGSFSEVSLSAEALEEIWGEVMEKVKPYNHSVHALLKASRPQKCEGGVVYLHFTYKFHKERIEEDKNRRLVEEVLSGVSGENLRLRCLFNRAGKTKQKSEKTVGVNEAGDRVGDVLSGDKPLSEDELVEIAQDILGGEVEDV